MQLVEEGQNHFGSGRCFICETACDWTRKVVNTRYHYDPEFQSPLVGPKYVCEFCASALAEAIGYVNGAKVAEQEAKVAEQEAQLKAIKSQVNSLGRQINKAT